MDIEALCAAPPEALAHSPSQMPLSCPVAPGRPKLMPGCGPAGRRALAHADTPNTSPGCRSCASAPSPTGARPRRRAADLAALPKRTSHVAGLQTTPRFAPSHTFKELMKAVRVVLKVCALARRRAPSPAGARPRLPARARRRAADLAALPKRTSHVAGLQTSPRFAPSHTLQRPYEETARVVSTVLLGTSHILRNILRRILRHVLHVLVLHVSPKGSGQSARKMPRKPPLGLPHQQRVQRAHCATMKKPFAWGLAGCARDQPCASWVSRSPTSRLNDRRLGLALVVQRSGQVRGSAHA